ncbi:hypothetical protein IBX73_04485 [candidate division WOR-3 bacterium]|nr:hypothetical protein [candidate division WOR-3 bacterium]
MLVFLLLFTELNAGYLNVTADRESMPIYVDNDFIGQTPIIEYPLRPDQYTVGFFPEDSIETASWRLKNGSISALWQLAKYGEGVAKVEIAQNRISNLHLDYREVMKAPGRAKLKVAACLGGTFMLGVLSVLAVQAIF